MKLFNLRYTPFSMAGSPNHVGLEQFGQGARLVYETTRRSVWRGHKGGWGSHFFRIELIGRDGELDYHASATPERLDLIHDDGSASIAFADPQTLLVRAEGATLRLNSCRAMGWQAPTGDRGLTIYDHSGDCTHHFRLASAGRLRCEPNRRIGRDGKKGAAQCGYDVIVEPSDGRPAVLAIRTTLHEQRFDQPIGDFDRIVDRRRREYADWQSRMPTVPSRYQAAAAFAWHMLWNQRIDPIGCITRPAVLMSRHWMHCVWPWDACFSALGIGAADPTLAWDQLLLHFDHQLSNGQIPDAVHDGSASFGWVKPPIQGWTISHLLRELPEAINAAYLDEAYEKVGRWTRWWFDCRDFDGDGLCSYVHGNDSGWDNATIFAAGEPVKAPDLAAHLVLQCQTLADLARRLGRDREAAAWDERAGAQLRRLLDHLVEGDRFIARGLDDQPFAARHSTILRMPVILGHRLPDRLRRSLVADLQPDGRFLTAHGLATEAIDSDAFERDGYWRGPMWAPPVYMAFDGLLDMGEDQLAGKLARRFCRTCAAEPTAMFENYDMTSGEGLRCKAYSWTAAVFIRLAHWLARRDPATDLAIATRADAADLARARR